MIRNWGKNFSVCLETDCVFVFDANRSKQRIQQKAAEEHLTNIPLLLSIQEWDRERVRDTQNEKLQLPQDFWEGEDKFR